MTEIAHHFVTFRSSGSHSKQILENANDGPKASTPCSQKKKTKNHPPNHPNLAILLLIDITFSRKGIPSAKRIQAAWFTFYLLQVL